MKRFLAALLAALTVFTLTGCGKTENPAEPVTPGQGEEPAAPTEPELTPEEIDMDHEAAEQLRHLCRDCDLGRLEELVKADKEGRTVVLPCKVGDTLYRVFAGEILEHKVGNMRYLAIQGRWDIETYPFCSYVESSIGKTIFLTREEAEAALEAMKDGNG